MVTVSQPGQIIAGGNLTINAASGVIASRNVTVITADTITNTGAIGGNTVQMAAAQDLNNLGGLIQGNRVVLTAGRDLNLTGTTQTTEAMSGNAVRLDKIATINAGDLTAVAGRDLNATAANIQAAGDATLTANAIKLSHSEFYR